MDYDYDLMGSEDDFYHDFYADNDALGDDAELSPWHELENVPPMTAYKLLVSCVQPSLIDGFRHLSKVLAWCIVYRLTTMTIQISKPLMHLMSVSCGVAVMYHFFDVSTVYLVAQGIVAYFSSIFAQKFVGKRQGWISMAACLGFLLTCELLIVDAVQWHRIRAAQMLVAMRAISLCFQLDDKSVPKLPDPFAYFGYLFHVGTVAFGPWVPYKDYINMDKGKGSHIKWIYHLTRSILVSLIFLSLSACWVMWLIPAGNPKWFMAYRDALSFRTSHYFISFLSEATALASGIDSSSTGDWQVVVTRPLHVELPRSLVEVVVNWNIPMHTWLRTYVFRVARPYGTFLAILATYSVSALLHGLNFQLAAVLLSLGFYTYTEHVTRGKLAAIFSACIGARKCGPQCGHRWQENHWAVKLANIGFALVAMFHLAYLGLMFDSSKQQEEGYSYWHVLAKWRWLNFASHWVVLATYIFYLMI